MLYRDCGLKDKYILVPETFRFVVTYFLFICKSEGEMGEREHVCELPSSDSHPKWPQSQDWARWKPEAKNSIRSPMWVAGTHRLGLSHVAFPGR